MACTNIDVTKEQTAEILQTIYTMISTNYPPYTIVDYVCAAVDISTDGVAAPEISATNWCLLTCVSSCLYKHSLFNAPSTYAYVNKPETYTCVTSCFPQFPMESASSSGGGVPPLSNAAIDNLSKWDGEQKKNVMDELEAGINWLKDILKRAFSNMSLTSASFAVWIAMLAEHLAEVTAANFTKKIGAAIDWISKAWKAAKDMANAAIDWAKTALTTKTDNNVDTTWGHFSKAVQGALTKVGGFITDMMKNAGQYIEQLGEFLYDSADRLYDLKEIAFAALALGAMLKEIMDLIKWTYDRVKQIIKAALSIIETLKEKYLSQSTNKKAEKIDYMKYAGMIKDTVNNKQSNDGSNGLMATAKGKISTLTNGGVTLS
jgi:hypothetical protein